MIFNKVKPNKTYTMQSMDYDTFKTAVENAFISFVVVGKTITISDMEYKICDTPSNISFKKDDIYDTRKYPFSNTGR